MADTTTMELVARALSLAQSHAQAPAIDILDLVMQPCRGCDLNFEADGQAFGDWTDPASPFGELLRRAFAADTIAADAARLWVSEDPAEQPAADLLVDQWQRQVLDRFAERYELWGA